jgi:urea transport system permease protein
LKRTSSLLPLFDGGRLGWGHPRTQLGRQQNSINVLKRSLHLLFVTAILFASHAFADPAQDFATAIAPLPDASYSEKADIVKRVGEIRAPGAKEFLQSFLDGTLYVRTEDKKLFIAVEKDTQLELTDPINQQPAGAADATALEKIGTNNGLRKALRGAIAQFDLANPDVAVRLAAVQDVLKAPDESIIEVLRQRAAVETDSDVKQAIVEGVALADLSSESPETKLAAIDALSESLNLEVLNRLKQMSDPSSNGDQADVDERVRLAARAAAQKIERWRGAYSVAETGFFGLSIGSVLVLSAIGLAITFGVMGVINMAHGELMMLGAYTTYWVQQAMPNHIGASVLVAIPVAFLVSGAVGMLIEVGVVKFLYGRPLETLLATFGVSLIMQQAVRNISGTANNVPVSSPDWLSGSIQFNEAFSITYNRLYIVLFTVIVFTALLLILKRTGLGLNVRAVAQNRAMAKAMGVRSEWVDTLTFGLGAGVAGVAGVALSQISNVGSNLGQQHIVDSFMVVVFGGVGNLWGTLVSGMTLGVINQVLEPFMGAVLAKILVLVALILFIQRRPSGLFPQKGRAVEH